MESQDQRSAVSAVVVILRNATRVVQIVPFVYLALYAFYMLVSPLVSDETLCIADTFMTVTPATIVVMLGLSRLFKLCPWHKAACLIPGMSQVETYIDSFVFTFAENEIIIINALIGLTTIVFIYLSFRHFFHGRKRRT